jgi:hypothetical protein
VGELFFYFLVFTGFCASVAATGVLGFTVFTACRTTPSDGLPLGFLIRNITVSPHSLPFCYHDTPVQGCGQYGCHAMMKVS